MWVTLLVNRAVQILLLFIFFLATAEALTAPLFAVFVTDFIEGATLATVGFSFAFYSITKSIFQLPIARWLDKRKGEYDDFFAMMTGAVISTIFPFLLMIISTPLHLYLANVFIGVGAAFLMASFYAVFARHVDRGSEGFEWSLYSVGGLTVSAAIGSAIGGVLADLIGFYKLFFISGIMTGIGTFLLLFLYPYLDGIRKKAVLPVLPTLPSSQSRQK